MRKSADKAIHKENSRDAPLKRVARLKGLEPLTHCLEGSCSIHLSYRRILERVMGIEPTRPAWKAGILPLNYTRMVPRSVHVSLEMIA